MAVTDANRQIVVFRLGQEEYGFDISVVKEIHARESVAKVPRSAKYIEGVTNLRGKLLTIVNLRRRFGMGPSEDGTPEKIIVVEAPESPVGFMVDEVSEVVRIGDDAIEKAPKILVKGIESHYVLGIAKHEGRLITLLDPVKVLELSEEPTEKKEG